MGKLIKRERLQVQELNEIHLLEAECSKKEQGKLHMKLNWEMLNERIGHETNDFLFYEDEKLVGFLGMYGFGRDEIEITGMVHPDYRRAGIFTQLVKAAGEECLNRNVNPNTIVNSMLFVTERQIEGASSFSKKAGASYEFSEYKMERGNEPVQYSFPQSVQLRKAESEDREFIATVDELCFGRSRDPLEEIFENVGDLNSTFIGIQSGQRIGKLRAVREENLGGIYGFGVLPELRGKGFGREMLLRAVEGLLQNGAKGITLEVESRNERALSLYKACGFREVTSYDYYRRLLVVTSKE